MAEKKKADTKKPSKEYDPRTDYFPPQLGLGPDKTYSRTGQDRLSSHNLTPAQTQAILNMMFRLANDYNNNHSGEIMAGAQMGIDQEAFANNPKNFQPAWQSDPWSMSQVGQAGGAPVDPRVAGNMNYFQRTNIPKNF